MYVCVCFFLSMSIFHESRCGCCSVFIHTHINRNLFCNHFHFFVDDHFSMHLHRCHTKLYSIKNARNFLYFIKFGHVRYMYDVWRPFSDPTNKLHFCFVVSSLGDSNFSRIKHELCIFTRGTLPVTTIADYELRINLFHNSVSIILCSFAFGCLVLSFHFYFYSSRWVNAVIGNFQQLCILPFVTLRS